MKIAPLPVRAGDALDPLVIAALSVLALAREPDDPARDAAAIEAFEREALYHAPASAPAAVSLVLATLAALRQEPEPQAVAIEEPALDPHSLGGLAHLCTACRFAGVAEPQLPPQPAIPPPAAASINIQQAAYAFAIAVLAMLLLHLGLRGAIAFAVADTARAVAPKAAPVATRR